MPNSGPEIIPPAPTASIPNSPNLFAKLAGYQSIIPEFDNVSSVTPKFFIDSVENVDTLVNCSPAERLIALKSRIRGDALAHVINSPDLSQEKDYAQFKIKFLAYFQNKSSLATRQQQFANCKMREHEAAKVFASRVTHATQQFFGNVNLQNEEVNKLFEQSKLSKFLEGLLPEYKSQIVLRDPQNFQDALNFVELLQANSSQLNSSHSQLSTPFAANAVESTTSNAEILQLLACHSQQTNDTISTLSKQLEELKLHLQTAPSPSPQQNTRQNFQPNRQNYQRTSQQFEQFSHRPHQPPRNQNPPCVYCRRNNHLTRDCFYAPHRTPQFTPNYVGQQTRTQNSRPIRGRNFNRYGGNNNALNANRGNPTR